MAEKLTKDKKFSVIGTVLCVESESCFTNVVT